MKYFLSLLLLFSSLICSAQKDLLTRFETSGGKETATYEEGIAYYQRLAKSYPEISLREMGLTDSGKPLHIAIYNSSGQFDFASIEKSEKPVLLINNAIHPGEPDGVEASMMLIRDIAEGKILKKEAKQFVLVVIPFYNVGGVLNRNSTTRANQNGPVEYGFRGNARFYDLNRDFIKGDTRNAKAFWEIFHLTDPDMFLDTHVSNGADYQYAITLIASQKDKLSLPMRKTMTETISPALYQAMDQSGEPMTPFVNVYGTTPDKGFTEFADWPRYSTGYTALFNTYGFMSETHMLKPFDRRVTATYQLMKAMVTTLVSHKDEILRTRQSAKESVKTQAEFPVKWNSDKNFSTKLTFKGFEGTYIESGITEQKRLYYDRSKPFEKTIDYRNKYNEAVIVSKPDYYLIPQGWHEVLARLRANQVVMTSLLSDTTIEVMTYRIADYETVRSAYEGHYYHYNTELAQQKEKIQFREGDFLIRCDQEVNRYIVETLEPLAEDSFFKWNFFDTVLGSKEGFSAYVFEEIAEDILANDKKLNEEFRALQKSDEKFASNRYLQLKFVYDRSVYKEKTHLLYPVYRLF